MPARKKTKAKSKKKKTVYQGNIYLFEADEDAEGEEVYNVSLLIHAALIVELARLLEEGELELTDRDQVKLGGRLYEAEDASYELSGFLYSKDIDRDDWPELVSDFSDGADDDDDDDDEPPRRSSSTKKKPLRRSRR